MDQKDALIAELQDRLNRVTNEMYSVMRDVHEGSASRNLNEITKLRTELAQEKLRTQRKDQIISDLGQLEQKIAAAVAANVQLQSQLTEANAKIAEYEKAERKANKRANKKTDSDNQG